MSLRTTLFLAVLGTLLLTGCVPKNIKQQEVSALEKGLSRHVVQAILKSGEPTGETALVKDGSGYVALRYNLVTGSTYQSTVICDKNGCYDVGGDVDTTSHFVVVLKNDKLHTWGTLDELAKSDDQAILDVVRQVRVIPEPKKGLFGL